MHDVCQCYLSASSIFVADQRVKLICCFEKEVSQNIV